MKPSDGRTLALVVAVSVDKALFTHSSLTSHRRQLYCSYNRGSSSDTLLTHTGCDLLLTCLSVTSTYVFFAENSDNNNNEKYTLVKKWRHYTLACNYIKC